MADYLDNKGKFDAHKWLRKNSEEKQPLKEEYIESIRRKHKTENDIQRASGKLQEDEQIIIIEEEE